MLPTQPKILTTPEEHQAFRDAFFAAANLQVDAQYMERSTVRGFYDNKGVLIGGFIVNAQAPFRYLSRSFVTPEHMQSPSMPDLNKTAEITCHWEARHITIPQKLVVGFTMIHDSLATGKEFFLGGSFHEKIANLQRLGLPNDIFCIDFVDPVTGAPGKHWFYYGRVSDMFKSIPKLWVRKIKQRARHRKEARIPVAAQEALVQNEH